MPAPRMTGKAVYKGTMNRTLEMIPAKFMKAFKDLIYAEALDVMSNVVGGGGITSVPIGIGNVSYDTSKMAAKSERVRQSALRKIGGAGGAVVIG